MNAWHSKSLGETLNELGTDRWGGLSAAEAAKRLEKYGPNRLEGKPTRPMPLRLLDQLKDPMILVLLSAARSFSSLW